MYGAVIVAAGKGLRLGGEIPKQFINLRGKPVLAHTVKSFLDAGIFQEIVLVLPSGFLYYGHENVVSPYFSKNNIKLVEGASERWQSVGCGLQKLSKEIKTVCVHDGVRPLVSPNLIHKVALAGRESQAATLAVPLKDTLKKVTEKGEVVKTLPREQYRLIQTPQCFSRELLEKARKQASYEGVTATDESSLVEATGQVVKVVEGSYRNIKITTPEDLVLAEALWEMKN